MAALEQLTGSRGRRTPRLSAIPGRRLTLVGEPSHLLAPLTGDLDGWWGAHVCRCRRLLPAELAWAAPLLDPQRPLPVLCGHEQARRLMIWHNHLPTLAQVSFTCQRLPRA